MNNGAKKRSTAGSSKKKYKLHKNVIRTYRHKGNSREQMDFNCLEKIYDNKLLCDFTFIVDGFELRAHKVILSICSMFFYWKFSQDRKSASFNSMEVNFLSYSTLSAVIGYLYTSEITVTEDNVAELMTAASKFVLRDLQKVCQNFLKKNLNSRNCVTFGTIARQFECEDVIVAVDDYIANNFEEVVKHNQLQKLSYEQIEKLISCDAIFATAETVLVWVLQWVRYDLLQRKDRILPLLGHVRFSSIPQKMALQRLEEERWLKRDPEYYNSVLAEVFKQYVLEESSRYLSKHLSNLKRTSKQMLVAGVTKDKCLSIELYDYDKDTWINVPHARGFQNTSGQPVILGSKIYYFGKTLTSIDFSKPERMLWSYCNKVFPMDIRHVFGLNDAIYIISYQTSRKILERLDPSSLTRWRLADPPMLVFRCVVAGNDNIYGITDSTEDDSSIYYFNTVTNKSWRFLSNIKKVGVGASASVVGDTLYIVGGGSAIAFNLSDHSQRILPDDDGVFLYWPGIICVKHKLYVMGGSDDYGIWNSLKVLDLDSNVWTTLSPMNVHKHDIVAAICLQ